MIFSQILEILLSQVIKIKIEKKNYNKAHHYIKYKNIVIFFFIVQKRGIENTISK